MPRIVYHQFKIEQRVDANSAFIANVYRCHQNFEQVAKMLESKGLSRFKGIFKEGQEQHKRKAENQSDVLNEDDPESLCTILEFRKLNKILHSYVITVPL